MPYDTAIHIGSGGMGEVFKAWDPTLERHVALKYLRHDDPELVERLMREARAQARVDHPGVCKVYEVGESEGRPFIAMQYVEGQLLDRAAQDLTLEQKVLLVKQVAEAVQAAHAEGLIHRDLKPGNIMVAEAPDGGLRPYVLDFGIARETEVAGPTVTGQILGTPGYLSPEQARGETATLDRRTDVFSLGVILYELLSGERPFSGESAVAVLISLLDNEPIPLRKRMPSVPRDLETVVSVCLEKDPDRRYPSAHALAEDLGRFLTGEPVEAHRAGFARRLLRTARKHRVAASLVAAFAISVVVLLGTLIAGWVKYTVDLRHERDSAEQSAAEAREVADFLAGVFELASPETSRGEEVTARELLDRGAKRIENELGDRPAVRARMLRVMGGSYLMLGLYDQALPLLERGLDEVLALPDHTAEEEVDARRLLADLSILRAELDRAADVAGPIERIVSETRDLDPTTAVVGLGCVGRVHLAYGRSIEADALFGAALEIAEQKLGPDALLVGDILNDRSVNSTRAERWEEAIACARRALEIREKALGEDDPRVATTLNNLGLALSGAGFLEEAAGIAERVLKYRERVLGPEHPRTGTAFNNLGLAYLELGRFDLAEEYFRHALEIREKAYGENHPRVGTVYSNLGGVFRERGDLELAKTTYLKALSVYENSVGPDHPLSTGALKGLAIIALKQGRYLEAERLVVRDLAIREQAYGSESFSLVGRLMLLAEVNIAQRNPDAARQSLERARPIAAQEEGDDGDTVLKIDAMLARIDEERSGQQ